MKYNFLSQYELAIGTLNREEVRSAFDSICDVIKEALVKYSESH